LCAIEGFDYRTVENRLDYHRANEHYRQAHRWALLLLRGSAFADLYSASGPDLRTFMLDMNALFEAFVTRLLRDAARGTGFTVQSQRTLPQAIRDEAGRTYTSVRPDLLLVQGRGPTTRRIPIDAKYKLYADKKISSGDLYQSFVYALSTSTAECPTAYVLYAADRDIPPQHITLNRPGRVPAARLVSIAVNVPAILKSSTTSTGHPAVLDELLAHLRAGVPT